MADSQYQPIYHFTRGEIVESIHFGAVAVVNSGGTLIAHHGDPHRVTFLRSTAKPFQALPFIARGGAEHFGMTEEEIALICASHSGTDKHVQTLQALQEKVGITEADLMCGSHPPYHTPTRKRLEKQGISPTSNRHNCSGKHTGMIAHAKLIGAPTNTYLNLDHPVQQHILRTLSTMCSLEIDHMKVGTDGCSVPTFAMPLYHAALGLARFVDPHNLPEEQAQGCQKITQAMTHNPYMVAGPERFDTQLMEIAGGKVLAKSGAEAYQGLGIPPHVLPDADQGLGIALKIADGDRGKRAKAPVVLDVLRQLGILTLEDLEQMAAYGPQKPIINYRNIVVGHGKPLLDLKFNNNL